MPFFAFEIVSPYRKGSSATGASKAIQCWSAMSEKEIPAAVNLLTMTSVLDDEIQIILVGEFDCLLNVLHALRANRIVRYWHIGQPCESTWGCNDLPKPGSHGASTGEFMKHWSSPSSHKIAEYAPVWVVLQRLFFHEIWAVSHNAAS
jgi:hypothetical protein